jgi:hypothetical protein
MNGSDLVDQGLTGKVDLGSSETDLAAAAVRSSTERLLPRYWRSKRRRTGCSDALRVHVLGPRFSLWTPAVSAGGWRSFGWGGSDVAPNVISLHVRTGKMAKEMCTREGTRKGKESVAFAHSLGGEDVSTVADVRDSGEQLCFSTAAILPEIRGDRGRRWWGIKGHRWGSGLGSRVEGRRWRSWGHSSLRGNRRLGVTLMGGARL